MPYTKKSSQALLPNPRKPLLAGRRCNVCMLGYKFMGRAHSNAFARVGQFFNVPIEPVMWSVVGRTRDSLQTFSRRWGWRHAISDWRAAVTDPRVDLVDIGTPNNHHSDIAIEALGVGKHVLCEKPLAATLTDARAMRDAARKSSGKTFVSYSYRRVPAIAFARQLVHEGRIGRVYHVRATYLQSWARNASLPLVWRFEKSQAGSGAHGDLNAHLVDMVRFITGLEITEVTGALQPTFIRERTVLSGRGGPSRMGQVTVDDASLFLASLEGGAVASFEATRFATGRNSKHGFEINGEFGALSFDFDNMSNLHFFDATLPKKLQGWQCIQMSSAEEHPYASAWWPAGHPIGYEHTFVNQLYDILQVLSGREPTVPLADFEDAYKTELILAAASQSAEERRPVSVSEADQVKHVSVRPTVSDEDLARICMPTMYASRAV